MGEDADDSDGDLVCPECSYASDHPADFDRVAGEILCPECGHSFGDAAD